MNIYSEWLRRVRNHLSGFILPALLILLWYVAADRMSLPAPEKVAEVILNPGRDLLASGSLLWNTGISLIRVIMGFILSVAVGTPLGFMMGESERFRKLTSVITELARPLSPLALLPLSIILFKDTNLTEVFGLDQLKYSRNILNELQLGMIFILGWGGVFPVILETMHGVRSVRKVHIEAARVLGAGRIFTFRHVLLPAALPDIFTGYRMAVGRCWMVIIAAEMLPGTNSGAGYLLRYSYQLSRLDVMLACIFVIALIGLLFSRGLERAGERRLRLRAGER